MPNFLLRTVQSTYHAIMPEPARLKLYEKSPRFLRKQLDRFGRRVAPVPFMVPTNSDIYYCYRLLLKRTPTDSELQSWRNHIDRFDFNLEMLVHDFMFSDEYVRREEQMGQPHCVSLQSFKLFVRLNDFATSAPIARTGTYEAAVTKTMGQYLKAGQTFVDVGANVGYFTMLAASVVGENGQVIAFEPNPANCELIRLSIAENEFDQIVNLRQTAVGANTATSELLIRGTESNARLRSAAENKDLSQAILTVPVVALDDELANIDKIDVIKIDVEGSEALVWKGMQRIVQQHRPVIFFEYFPAFIRTVSGSAPLELINAMSSSGYVFYLINEDIGEKVSGPFSPQQVTTIQEQAGLQLVNLIAIAQEDNKPSNQER